MQAATHPVSYWATRPLAASFAARFAPEAGLVRLIQSNAGSKCRDEEFASPDHARSITRENGVTWIIGGRANRRHRPEYDRCAADCWMVTDCRLPAATNARVAFRRVAWRKIMTVSLLFGQTTSRFARTTCRLAGATMHPGSGLPILPLDKRMGDTLPSNRMTNA
jgi:hypothetical protein